MKLIGIISDIHGYLPKKAHDELRKSDYIICAGDCESQQVILELDSIAPTIVVKGNCDHFINDPNFKIFAEPRIENIHFLITHKKQDLKITSKNEKDIDIVIYGHTHIPQYFKSDGITYINPGSPTRPRGNSEPGLGLLVIDKGKIMSYKQISLV